MIPIENNYSSFELSILRALSKNLALQDFYAIDKTDDVAVFTDFKKREDSDCYFQVYSPNVINGQALSDETGLTLLLPEAFDGDLKGIVKGERFSLYRHNGINGYERFFGCDIESLLFEMETMSEIIYGISLPCSIHIETWDTIDVDRERRERRITRDYLLSSKECMSYCATQLARINRTNWEKELTALWYFRTSRLFMCYCDLCLLILEEQSEEKIRHLYNCIFQLPPPREGILAAANNERLYQICRLVSLVSLSEQPELLNLLESTEFGNAFKWLREMILHGASNESIMKEYSEFNTIRPGRLCLNCDGTFTESDIDAFRRIVLLPAKDFDRFWLTECCI